MKKERPWIRAVQMDNLRGLLGISRMYKFPNARIRELCGVTKGLMKVFSDASAKRMENDRIANRVYVGKCGGSRSVGRPRKRWIDTVENCLKKRGLDVRKARRMEHDRSVWWLFVRRNGWGRRPEDEPLTLT